MQKAQHNIQAVYYCSVRAELVILSVPSLAVFFGVLLWLPSILSEVNSIKHISSFLENNICIAVAATLSLSVLKNVVVDF